METAPYDSATQRYLSVVRAYNGARHRCARDCAKTRGGATGNLYGPNKCSRTAPKLHPPSVIRFVWNAGTGEVILVSRRGAQ